MLRSMTGYGTGSYQSEDTTVAVEVRTVNHRFLDVHIRIPREYSFLEPDIHQWGYTRPAPTVAPTLKPKPQRWGFGAGVPPLIAVVRSALSKASS